jgi:hypothetical protein
VVEGLGAGKDRGVDGPLARDIYITRGGKGRVVSDFAPGHGNRYSRAYTYVGYQIWARILFKATA